MRLLEGRVDVASFERSASAEVRALAQKITWIPLAVDRFPTHFEAVIRCELVSGETVTQRIDDVDGNHSRPPSHERVLAKFKANAALTLTPAGVDALCHAMENLDMQADVSAMGQALKLIGH
jgi:hypothetical protein